MGVIVTAFQEYGERESERREGREVLNNIASIVYDGGDVLAITISSFLPHVFHDRQILIPTRRPLQGGMSKVRHLD